MASPYKTSKAELVAIYRLEFYKKQKSWKYCSQERKKEEEKRKAARKAQREKLNQTYDIEPAPEKEADPVDKEAEELKDLNLAEIGEKKEQVSKEIEAEEESAATPSDEKADDLNEAFVDTETDDTAILPTQLDSSTYPYSPKWSIQYWTAQRRRLWKQQDQPPCPNQNTQVYPTQDSSVYPTQDTPAYPTQDTPAYPAQDTQEYLNQVTQIYPTPKTQVYPTQNCLIYPTQDNQVYLAQNYPTQQTQDYPTQDIPVYHKQITQVYPIPKSQGYPTELSQPNLYSPESPYRADIPTFSPALPQCGASVYTREPRQYELYEHDGWPTQSQVWTRHEWQEGVDPPGARPALAAGDAGDAGDAVDGPAGMLGRARCWLSGSLQSESARCESLLSVSSESFSRGAALAPHSTEIDLRISSSSEEMAAGLSTAALSAAVARHADALQTLLGEAKKRDLVSPSIEMHSFDEYPTRDVPSCPTFSSEVIIAGSFQNKPDLSGQTDQGASRGRGKRLYDTAVIGIGRGGRPYRI